MLVVGRIISGLCVGLASAIVPVYQSEITPPAIRGRLVSLQYVFTFFLLPPEAYRGFKPPFRGFVLTNARSFDFIDNGQSHGVSSSSTSSNLDAPTSTATRPSVFLGACK